MPRNAKLTDEERMSAVQEYLDGKGTLPGIAQKYGVSYSEFRRLVLRAKSEGIESIKISTSLKKYSEAVKKMAVSDYLSGKGSQDEICLKYKISSRSILRRWIKCYNSDMNNEERKSSERGNIMKNGRKTTQEERMEIVLYCIENGRNYKLAMEKYGISYQQICPWVRKYETKGADGLIDRRGKRKTVYEMTEVEKLQMEVRILQAKLRNQEMENQLLKKLRELRGGGH